MAHERPSSVVSFRAIMDQWDALHDNFVDGCDELKRKNEKMERLKRFEKRIFRCGMIMLIVSLISSIFDSGYALPISRLTMAIMFCGLSTAVYLLFMQKSISKGYTKILSDFDKVSENLWGSKNPPVIHYRHDEYLNEFELHLTYKDDSEPTYIGRIPTHDEIAKNFKKSSNN